MRLILLFFVQTVFLVHFAHGQNASKNGTYSGSKYNSSSGSMNGSSGSANPAYQSEKKSNTQFNTNRAEPGVQKNNVPQRETAVARHPKHSSVNRTTHAGEKTPANDREGYTPAEVSKLFDGIWVTKTEDRPALETRDTSFHTEAGIAPFSDECAGKIPLLLSEFIAMSRDERMQVMFHRENYCFREFSQIWRINTLSSALYFCSIYPF